MRPTLAKTACLAVLALTLAGGQGALAEERTAVFAGGCFWCMEPPYDKLDGVLSTVSGYTGGTTDSPTYKQVTKGGTGHLEAVQVTYDSEKVDYATLLKVFWRNIDPFDDKGQFCDKGDGYRTAIFVADDAERKLAEETKAAHEKQLGMTIVTRILPRAEFFPAEEYHQDYYMKNPFQYRFYRYSCGRDDRLREVWRG